MNIDGRSLVEYNAGFFLEKIFRGAKPNFQEMMGSS